MTQLALMGSGTESPFDSIRREDERGEFWTGRDLMPLMDYGRWHEFAAVIEKATASLALVEGAEAAGHHFVVQHSDGGRWGNQSLEDYRLTRFAAYLTAMAGDDTKEAVARARIYFAVKTRKAEIVELDQNRAVLPRNFAEALRRYADEVESHEQTRAQLEIAGPKAEAWDVLASKNGDMSVRRAAFCLNRDPNISTGQNRLFRWLRDNRWIDKKNVPYAAHEKHVRLRVYTHEGHDKQQVRVTVQGLSLLLRRLGGSIPVSDLVTQADLDGED